MSSKPLSKFLKLPGSGAIPRLTSNLYVFGEFRLDAQNRVLRRSQEPVPLASKAFELLLVLVKSGGRAITKDELMQAVWPDSFVEESNLTQTVFVLRKALGETSEQRYIMTVPGKGYRFIAPVTNPESEKEVVSSPAQSPVSENLIGKKVSHYRVLQLLGGGGMGVVYNAEDLKLGRQVAMKFLPGELASDPVAFERLQREARAASSLDHPNICSIYELGEHEGQPFIVMQLLEGQTLREWIESAAEETTHARLNQLLDFAIQVAGGLEAAHQKGIIHRDIKPPNIFITRRGEAKILDFGVAKFVDSAGEFPSAAPADDGAEGSAEEKRIVAFPDASLTRTGLSMGTPSYLSPEQVRREKLDARTDIFSFGLVLHEMATGQQAFSGNTVTVIREAVLRQPAIAVRQLDPGLPPELEKIITKALEKDRNIRYQNAAEIRTDLQLLMRAPGIEQPLAINAVDAVAESNVRRISSAFRGNKWKIAVLALAVAVAGLIGSIVQVRSKRARALTDKDTIVLADFTNITGDSVFDDTLKQGLSVQLEQSPFLALISERRVNETLKLMGRPMGGHLTPEVTREVCLRTGSKAMLTGSIASLGSQYVIGLRAVNCDTGDVLAETQQRAAGKESVLKALDAATVSMRSNLGESLSTVQKYATPLREATTSSLEALKTYSLAMKTGNTIGAAAALPFLKRAVELDPAFPEAYSSISSAYGQLNEQGRAAEYARKAYELRGKASEVERFAIETNYYELATREPEKAAQMCELWRQTYPRDARPLRDLAYMYANLGNHEKALERAQEALQMGPRTVGYHLILGREYASINRLDEAKGAYKEAEQRKLEDEPLLLARYQLAFVGGDAAQMARVVAAAVVKPGADDLLLAAQSDTEAWYGKLRNARELTQRAMDSAEQSDAKETAATYQAEAALREVESGKSEWARTDAQAA